MSRLAAIALLLVLIIPISAAAQEDESQQSQGPMTVERVHNTWAIAPDFKVTKVDGTTGRAESFARVYARNKKLASRSDLPVATLASFCCFSRPFGRGC